MISVGSRWRDLIAHADALIATFGSRSALSGQSLEAVEDLRCGVYGVVCVVVVMVVVVSEL